MNIAFGLLVGFVAGFLVAVSGATDLYKDRARNGFIVIDDKMYRVTPTPMQ